MATVDLGQFRGLFTPGGEHDGIVWNGHVPAGFFRCLSRAVARNQLRQIELGVLGVSPAVVCNYCRACLCIGAEGGVQKIRQPAVVGITFSGGTYNGGSIQRDPVAPREWLAGVSTEDVVSCPRTGRLMDDLTGTEGDFPKVRVGLVEQ